MSLPTKLLTLDLLIQNKQKELDKIISRKRKEINPIIKKRNNLEQKLYEFMKVRNLTIYQGINIKDIEPKEKKVKKDKPSRDFQLQKLRQMGIRNPQEALNELGI